MADGMNGHYHEELWPVIKQALCDDRFDLRTINGLSKAIGADPEEVKATVMKHKDALRFSEKLRGRNGEYLFTLATRPKGWREKLSEIRQIFVDLV